MMEIINILQEVDCKSLLLNREEEESGLWKMLFILECVSFEAQYWNKE